MKKRKKEEEEIGEEEEEKKENKKMKRREEERDRERGGSQLWREGNTTKHGVQKTMQREYLRKEGCVT